MRGEMRWKRRKVFRYEACWDKEEGCVEVLKEAWHKRQRDINDRKILVKLEDCKAALLSWSKLINSDRAKELKKRSESLQKLQDEESRVNVEEIKRLQREIRVLLEKEDLKWKQRAKRNWYAMGDKNTKFFHACATQRKRKNVMKQIMDEHKQLFNNQEDIEGAFNRYFKSLFASTRLSPKDIAVCVQQVEP
ncbi:uncharacterized protein LOC122299035 [Carya illinoinensis]|uniref:uncharacterized protein LOC122299035 n=1 Tax=Carya illinoinensis TaxID=32201 RepID=UPI001C7255D4|nr:uncharacterized protein LOC122299035 [Carya illinoinensis]